MTVGRQKDVLFRKMVFRCHDKLLQTQTTNKKREQLEKKKKRGAKKTCFFFFVGREKLTMPKAPSPKTTLGSFSSIVISSVSEQTRVRQNKNKNKTQNSSKQTTNHLECQEHPPCFCMRYKKRLFDFCLFQCFIFCFVWGFLSRL